MLVFSISRGQSPTPAAMTPARPRPVVSGEFVGAIPNSDPKDPPGGAADELVAVVVNDPSLSDASLSRTQ